MVVPECVHLISPRGSLLSVTGSCPQPAGNVSSQPAPSEASFLTTLYPWLHLSPYASLRHCSPRPSMLSLMPGPPDLVRADGKPHM